MFAVSNNINTTIMETKLTSTDLRAIKEFGRETCIKAYRFYKESGNGAPTVAEYMTGGCGVYKRNLTAAGNRMIDAGRKLSIAI